MRTSVSGTLVVTLLLCTCLEAARTRYPHLKRPERLKRAKRLVPTNELDDFTFFSTVGKNSDVLVMFYRDNCPKCENVKKEMQDFLRAGGKNFDIGFVNIDRNPLVAKDIGAAREFKSFKLALFEKRSHTPKVYPLPSYDAESLLMWAYSSIDHRQEHSQAKASPKPYEEINKIVFEDTKFKIKTWHKVVFFLTAGLGIAAVSYIIKKDLETRHNSKVHIV